MPPRPPLRPPATSPRSAPARSSPMLRRPSRSRRLPLLAPLPPSLMDEPEEKSDGITVFVAKRIVTMDPGWPTGEAVAVKDGRILSVGTLEDLQPWLKRFPYKIDETFKDKVIYPGFVEAHGHPVMGSVAISRPPLSFFPLRNPYGEDFPGVKTRGRRHCRAQEIRRCGNLADRDDHDLGLRRRRHGRGFPHPRRTRPDFQDQPDHRLGRLGTLRLRQFGGDRAVRRDQRAGRQNRRRRP